MERERHTEVVELNGYNRAFRVIQFEAPSQSFGQIDAESAAAMVAAAADVALVMDPEGIIRDVAFGSDELSREGYLKWIGQPWSETVTSDSRGKVLSLLQDAVARPAGRWRQINHPSSSGPDVPILYSAIQIGRQGKIVAFGRDLRATAALQQRLVEAQQTLERDYWRLRHIETRYRMLFQMASEAVLVVDASSLKVVEANPAAGAALHESASRLPGRPFPEGFDEDSMQAIQTLLAGARAVGRGDDITVRLTGDSREFVMSASLFRQEGQTLFLVRLSPVRGDLTASPVPRTMLKFVDAAPDGFVVTEMDGSVLTANRAFLELTQIATEQQMRGESLDRWLGRSGLDMNVLIASLRQHGSVRLFASTIRGEHGALAEVEISGVSVPQGHRPCLGFIIRNIGRRVSPQPVENRELPRSVSQLTELVGRVPLKELVRESTDLIEKLCIEAALELTSNNRASAAEMLGLSRQSLYVKLRRYGLGDLSAEADDDATGS